MIEIKNCPKCGKPKERVEIVPIITDKLDESDILESVKYADVRVTIECKCRGHAISVQYVYVYSDTIIDDLDEIFTLAADNWNREVEKIDKPGEADKDQHL